MKVYLEFINGKKGITSNNMTKSRSSKIKTSQLYRGTETDRLKSREVT